MVGPLLSPGFAPGWVAPKAIGLLLSFESKGAEVLDSDTRVSSSRWLNPPSAGKKALTSIFRITV